MPIFLVIYFLVILFFIVLATILMFRADQHKGQEEADKSNEVIHSAIQKAQTLISSAEMDSMRILSDSKFYREQVEGKIEGEFTQFASDAQKVIAGDVAQSEKDFLEYMNALKTNLDKSSQDYLNYINYLKNDADLAKNQNQEAIKTQINSIFVKLEENLSQFLTETQQKSTQSIELELQAARQLIETYKEQQLKIVDENILAMLETTLSLVLGKKLSLQDQLDLIYQSLEKAKSENFVV